MSLGSVYKYFSEDFCICVHLCYYPITFFLFLVGGLGLCVGLLSGKLWFCKKNEKVFVQFLICRMIWKLLGLILLEGLVALNCICLVLALIFGWEIHVGSYLIFCTVPCTLISITFFRSGEFSSMTLLKIFSVSDFSFFSCSYSEYLQVLSFLVVPDVMDILCLEFLYLTFSLIKLSIYFVFRPENFSSPSYKLLLRLTSEVFVWCPTCFISGFSSVWLIFHDSALG